MNSIFSYLKPGYFSSQNCQYKYDRCQQLRCACATPAGRHIPACVLHKQRRRAWQSGGRGAVHCTGKAPLIYTRLSTILTIHHHHTTTTTCSVRYVQPHYTQYQLYSSPLLFYDSLKFSFSISSTHEENIVCLQT